MLVTMRLLIVFCFSLVVACTPNPFLSDSTRESGKLSQDTVLRHASSEALKINGAHIITGNDDAFRSKLEMVKSATKTIDAMYYIYSDDYSSSVLSEALIDAAKRGVRVQLLVDYHTNYSRLDMFTLMERLGKGGLEVRFYNRPARNIVMDAAFLTMGCGEAREHFPQDACSKAKVKQVTQRFADERIDGTLAADLHISNLSSRYSGLFLSGLYSKQPDLMAYAILNGQEIDPSALSASAADAQPEQREQLKQLGKLYVTARVGAPLRRLSAKVQLAVLGIVASDKIDPLHEALTSYLPVERPGAKGAADDWEYLTDFLHHKLLLVDNRAVQLGGRNVEDSYHMRPNPLVEKYVFMDTDLRADLRAGGDGIQQAFESLWNSRLLVATTKEVRQHAPNDIAANSEAFSVAEKSCKGSSGEAQLTCVDRVLSRQALTLAQREARYENMLQQHARKYWSSYKYARSKDDSPEFTVDPTAFMVYVENLPFSSGRHNTSTARSYGSRNGHEAEDGKRIHSLWLEGLSNTCRTATAAQPKRVILHQAYFFPPSNLIQQMGRMIDGKLDCRHVTVTVLTNSLETTDLNVVNLFARHSAKAFVEFYARKRHPERAARFEYFEYREFQADAKNSLHTKVAVFGDDMFVGSANADIRSLMMDTNNGFFLRQTPTMLKRYVEYVDALLQDKNKTTEMTSYFVKTPHDKILTEDMTAFRAILSHYRAERWINAEKQRDLETQLTAELTRAYHLTADILGGRSAKSAAQKFDRLLKPI